jgi:hypothetical protein
MDKAARGGNGAVSLPLPAAGTRVAAGFSQAPFIVMEAGFMFQNGTQPMFPTDSGTFTIERRQDRRRKALKSAKLSFNGGFFAAEAVIRDMHERGARLEVARTGDLAQDFTLTISGQPKPVAARIVWRGDRAIGVRFLNA